MNRFIFFVFACAVIGLAWLSAGISLLDDDWGHLRLGAKGLNFLWTTGWEGLVGQGGYYRPIVVLSFYVNYLIGGFEPAGYHIVNVIIHAGCTVLVFVLGKQLGFSQWICLGGASLFFVLPIHTDSVFWIVGRTDTLCALFYLGCMVVFLRVLDSWSVLWMLLLCVCAGLAFLSKEMALTLPGVLVVLAWSQNRLQSPAGLWGILGCVATLLLYFVIRWLVLGGLFSGTPPAQISFLVWGIDFAKSLAKFGMTGWKWFGIVVLGITGWLYLRIDDKSGSFENKKIILLIGVCVISLLPVLGRLHNWYLYLPSAFFCLGVAGIWLHNASRFRTILFTVILVYYAGTLTREGYFWRDASRLSEQFITNILSEVREVPGGRLFILNTPAAWTPEGSFGGKPLFVFALKNALSMHSEQQITTPLVLLNHVWLRNPPIQCKIERTDNLIKMKIVNGGTFAFFGNGEGLTPPFVVDETWGTLYAHTPDSISVEVSLTRQDRLVVFDNERVRSISVHK